jgi:hypothetical protein
MNSSTPPEYLFTYAKTHNVVDVVAGRYFLNQFKIHYEEKLGFKYSRDNPFGITVNSEQYPYQNYGKFWYPKKYYVVKASLENIDKVNK